MSAQPGPPLPTTGSVLPPFGFLPAPRVRPGAVLIGLARARRTVALYGSGHPVTEKTIGEVYGTLSAVLESRQSLRVFMHEDTFYVGRTVLLEESLRLSSLLLELRDRQIGTIEFRTGLEAWEVTRLAETLNLRPAELQRAGGAAAALEGRGVQHVSVSAARPLMPDEQVEIRVDPRDVYRAGLRVIDDLYYQASRDVPLDLRKASMVVASLVDVLTADRSALLGIAALKHYDEETAHHSVNVAILSLMVALHLRLERALAMAVGLAALLHDVGKVRVPHEILTKEEPLTLDEEALLRQHPFFGAHLLRNLPGSSRLAMIVAFEHHANFNLSGYPPITAKENPHPLTRIVQIADFYDAATASAGAERPAMPPYQAVRFILDGAGRVFDPMLARIFVQVLGLYPVGSVVELDDGEVGVVQRPGEREAERPVVKIVADGARHPVVPRIVSLDEAPERRIARPLDPDEAQVRPAEHL